MPLRQYSFGMRLRLGFAFMVNIEPDILLIDESLAVGDLAFRQKCFAGIERMKRTGTSFILVSHHLDEIERLCERTALMDKGRIKTIGLTKEVIGEYARRD